MFVLAFFFWIIVSHFLEPPITIPRTPTEEEKKQTVLLTILNMKRSEVKLIDGRTLK